MTEKKIKIYYPFKRIVNPVSTVALYGQNPPVIVHGNLILRVYYTDEKYTSVDQKRTNDATMDTIFFETNKVIREQLGDNYTNRRILRQLALPEIGKDYYIVYNIAETPSPRYDDLLPIVSNVDDAAHGTAIILKQEDTRLTWLSEEEADAIAAKLNVQ